MRLRSFLPFGSSLDGLEHYDRLKTGGVGPSSKVAVWNLAAMRELRAWAAQRRPDEPAWIYEGAS